MPEDIETRVSRIEQTVPVIQNKIGGIHETLKEMKQDNSNLRNDFIAAQRETLREIGGISEKFSVAIAGFKGDMQEIMSRGIGACKASHEEWIRSIEKKAQENKDLIEDVNREKAASNGFRKGVSTSAKIFWSIFGGLAGTILTWLIVTWAKSGVQKP